MRSMDAIGKSKRPARPPHATSLPHNFDAVFARLRAILVPYARTLAAKNDQPDCYYLETKAPLHKGRPVFFAAVPVTSCIETRPANGDNHQNGKRHERVC